MIGSVQQLAKGATNQAAQMSNQVTQSASASAQAKNEQNQSLGIAPYVLVIVFGGLYLLWAFLSRKEKFAQAIKPQNLAINFYNFFLIFLSVVISVPLGKIIFTKLATSKITIVRTIFKPVAHIVNAA